jgi:diguanylate cyclase (GGDEF)-like protein/PAS domain S-box-containing protein
MIFDSDHQAEASIAAAAKGESTHPQSLDPDETKNRLQLASLLIDENPEGVLMTDAGGTIMMINPAVSRITGYQPAEVLGKTPRILRSGRHDKNFYRNMWTALAGRGRWQGNIWNRRKNGRIYLQKTTIHALADEGEKQLRYASIFSDVTAIRSTERALKHMATHDYLTGLPNRLLMMDRLAQALTRAERCGYWLAVLFLDLDRFKPVNDRFGHQVGDTVLRHVARRLADCVRRSDTVARIGGDEFLVILSDLQEPHGIASVAGKIVESLSKPFPTGAHRVQIGASIGISLFPQDGTNADQLISMADTAMYTAKKTTDCRFIFASSILRSLARP